MLFTAAASWRKIKAEHPQRLDRPTTSTLMVCLFAELETRLKNLHGKPEAMAHLAQVWLVGGWPPYGVEVSSMGVLLEVPCSPMTVSHP